MYVHDVLVKRSSELDGESQAKKGDTRTAADCNIFISKFQELHFQELITQPDTSAEQGGGS